MNELRITTVKTAILGSRIVRLVIGAGIIGTLSLPALAEPQERQKQQARRPAAAAPAPEPLKAEGPLLMLVSLNKQRMYVYDSKGLVTQSRISSGMKGFDTPVGIYSILQKNEHHRSNIYDDAPMPHMQRLTMTGIALHGGVVPGYPASHGCVRLPFDFARKLFGMTEINQRVVISPDVQSPVNFDHPLLFAALPPGDAVSVSDGSAGEPGLTEGSARAALQRVAATAELAPRTLLSVAEERTRERIALVDAAQTAKEAIPRVQAEAEAAARAAADARAGLKRAQSAAERARRTAIKAEKVKTASEKTLAVIRKRLAAGASKMTANKLEALRKSESEAADRLAALTAAATEAAAEAERTKSALSSMEGEYKEKVAASKKAKAAVSAAIAAEKSAAHAVVLFDRAERNRELPVSVFISAKTSKIMIRQGFEAVLEAEVEIENPNDPLGTYLMTATGWRDSSRTSLNWTVTAVSEHSLAEEGQPVKSVKTRGGKNQSVLEPPRPTNAAAAAAALDRIKIPKNVIDKISEVVKPGSTFIISDYDVSKSETRYAGTDFIVQMPEVVAKITRPKPKPREYFDDDDYGWSLFWGGSGQKRRPSRPYGGKFYF